MRVVSGIAGGLRLVAPAGHATRPTSDRVREATFNALGSLGVLDDATVLDLYAGSGAMGIEALSRGASHATFVDRDRAAIAAITANLHSTGLADRATVRNVDAVAFVSAASAKSERFDLAIIDPPYAFDEWESLLTALPADVVVIESGRPVTPGAGWEEVRQKRYGSTVVTIARRHQPCSEPSETS